MYYTLDSQDGQYLCSAHSYAVGPTIRDHVIIIWRSQGSTTYLLIRGRPSLQLYLWVRVLNTTLLIQRALQELQHLYCTQKAFFNQFWTPAVKAIKPQSGLINMFAQTRTEPRWKMTRTVQRAEVFASGPNVYRHEGTDRDRCSNNFIIASMCGTQRRSAVRSTDQLWLMSCHVNPEPTTSSRSMLVSLHHHLTQSALQQLWETQWDCRRYRTSSCLSN